MKQNLIFAAVVTALLMVGGDRAIASPGVTLERHVRPFYTPLSRYGEWIRIDGITVWRPVRVRASWRPYGEGQWVWTDNGWYWMSDEPFGWATYHYGRWYHDRWYGWIWIPDDVWGPAWVEWRYDDDYVGWAPLPPYAVFQVNVGIHFTRHWEAPHHYWYFVSTHKFGTRVRFRDAADEYRTRRLLETTRRGSDYGSDHGRIVNRGIDRAWWEERSHRTAERREIRETSDRGNDGVIRERNDSRNEIQSYRPRMDERSDERVNPQIRDGGRRSTLDIESLQRRTDSDGGAPSREPDQPKGTRNEEKGNVRPSNDSRNESSGVREERNEKRELRPRVMEVPSGNRRTLERPSPPSNDRQTRDSRSSTKNSEERPTRRR